VFQRRTRLPLLAQRSLRDCVNPTAEGVWNVARPTSNEKNQFCRSVLAAAVAGVVFAISGAALADDISNNLDASVDAVAEVMTLNVGGPNGATKLYVVPQNGDGKSGCNLTGSTTLVLSVSSNNTSVATVSPSSVTFTSCGTEPTLTVTPHNQGSATISVSQTSNSTGGTFNLAPATFTVNVAPPPNTPPHVSIDGATLGSSYEKGSVPAATCQVTDAEDGNSSFPATLSSISGPYASDGIGQQEASCSYADGGGLTAAASVTYNIFDPSAPSIGYTLDPASPDGLNGWYRSDVSLAWSVVESESPNSLVTAGCVDQSITADQFEITYACSAMSAGGSAGPLDVSIKRDATLPDVSGAPTTAPNGAGWYNGDVAIDWTCSDATSGVADCPDDSPISSEGSGLAANSGDVYDNAGNSTNATSNPAVNIDKTKPTIAGSVDPVTPEGDNDWYESAPTVTFTCDDALSGIESCVVDGTSPASDHVTLGESASPQTVGGTALDKAGNSETASVSGLKVDLSDPAVQCNATPTFMVGQLGMVSVSVTDSISGPAQGQVSAQATNPNGGSVTLTGYDNAGRSTTVSCPYHVVGTTFLQPINGRPTVNLAKAGRVIPVKVQIVYDGVAQTDQNTPSGAVTVGVGTTSCVVTTDADDIEAYAAGSSNTGLQFRWEPTGAFWIYNLDTSSFAMKPSNCYQASVYLNGVKAGYFFVKITK
jgi:hypothetical protein